MGEHRAAGRPRRPRGARAFLRHALPAGLVGTPHELHVVRTLIAEQGFSATTVDEIADRAGVAKGTVYYNFASKNVLYEELLRDGIDLLADSLRRAADATAARGGTRVDALDAMIRAGLDFIACSPALIQLYVAELWRTNRTWRATLTSVRGRFQFSCENA